MDIGRLMYMYITKNREVFSLPMSITPEKCYDEYPLIRILSFPAENLMKILFCCHCANIPFYL